MAGMVVHVSLLVSPIDWRSCHFLANANSKCTCTSLCAYGRVGLKMRCGQAHRWGVAILRQRKAIVLLTKKQKNRSKVNGAYVTVI